MNRKSRNVYVACCIGSCIQFINCVISAVLLLSYYSAGRSTIIGFISNVMIQGGFVFKGAEIAHIDWKHHLCRTILAEVPISYNKVNQKMQKQV